VNAQDFCGLAARDGIAECDLVLERGQRSRVTVLDGGGKRLDAFGLGYFRSYFEFCLGLSNLAVGFSFLCGEVEARTSLGRLTPALARFKLGTNVRVSMARGGGDPNEASTQPAQASDAPVVAFTSKAQNLVVADENDKDDVFVAPRN
jgi:hypothetical protein